MPEQSVPTSGFHSTNWSSVKKPSSETMLSQVSVCDLLVEGSSQRLRTYLICDIIVLTPSGNAALGRTRNEIRICCYWGSV